jgi:hypothetical protein
MTAKGPVCYGVAVAQSAHALTLAVSCTGAAAGALDPFLLLTAPALSFGGAVRATNSITTIRAASPMRRLVLIKRV